MIERMIFGHCHTPDAHLLHASGFFREGCYGPIPHDFGLLRVVRFLDDTQSGPGLAENRFALDKSVDALLQTPGQTRRIRVLGYLSQLLHGFTTDVAVYDNVPVSVGHIGPHSPTAH